MLSIAKLSSANQAANYYEKDNYYLKDAPEIKENTQWFGIGAKQLNLSGSVDSDMFKSLLEGKLPDGTQLGREIKSSTSTKKTMETKPTLVHRPGYDLTFSAPKSVSLMALIGEDKAIIKAHEKAVDKALKFIEKNASQTRLMQNKKIVKVKTDNLVVARFQHDTSRELDPHLHTHCVVLNITATDKGWRSLSSEKLYDNKMAAGAFYRATLAHELQKLGYGIIKKKADGRFEIASIPDNVIKQFSKRRQQVEKALEENQQEGAVASAELTLRTRQSKKRIDRETLKQHWEVEAALCQFNFKAFQKQVQAEPTPQPTAEKIEMAASTAVSFAINHLSETKSVLEHDSLCHFALNETVGQRVSLKHIERAVLAHIHQGELLIQTDNEKAYTTPLLLKKENTVLTALKETRTVRAITSAEDIEKFLQTNVLTSTQTDFAKLILQTDKPYVVVEHFKALEDVGLIKKVGWVAALRNHRVRLFTTSQKNADWFKSQLQLKTSTHSALLSTPEKIFNKWSHRQLWFIDKTERLSTHDLEAITTRATAARAHVVFLTNTTSLPALQAGNTTALLKKADLPTVFLREPSLSIQSKKPMSELQTSISSLFTQLSQDKQVIAYAEKNNRFHAIAQHLLSAPTTQVIALQADIREALSYTIRATKQSAGLIHKEEQTVTIWTRAILSETEKKYTRYYKIGQQCQFQITHPQLPIRKNTPYLIHHIDDHALQLKSSDGKIISWDPHQIPFGNAVTVYDPQTRNIAVGDNLRMTTPDTWKKWIAGDVLTVMALTADKINLKNEAGKNFTIPVHKPEGHYFDYAYVRSPYQLNEQEQGPLLLHIESRSFNLTAHRLLLTTLSHSRELWIATDDAEQLKAKLEKWIPDAVLVSDHTFKEQLKPATSVEKNADYFAQRMSMDTVECAIDMLSEREAVFSALDLHQKVLELGTGSVSEPQLQQAINELMTQNELMAVTHNEEPAYTTLSSLEREQAIVDWVTESAHQFAPFHNELFIDQKLAQCPLTLNAEQTDAVKKIFTSPHQLIGIQGYAGTGKTRLLQAVKFLADDATVPILGLAPSASAAEQLFIKSGIERKTLARFLIEAKQPDFSEKYREKPSILIVDESSMVSNRQALALKEAVSHLPIHVIAQGDIYQLSAVESGKPFAILQTAGMETVKLKAILRQQNAPQLLKAIYDTVENKNVQSAWRRLSPYIHDEKTPAVNVFLKKILPLGSHAKENTLYLAKSAQNTISACWLEKSEYKLTTLSTQNSMALFSQLPVFPVQPEKSITVKNTELIETVAKYCNFPEEQLYISPLSALLKEYKSMDANTRKNTLILTAANETRVSIGTAIREILKEEGTLHSEKITSRILVSQNLTLVEQSLAIHYENGWVIRFNTSNRRLGIEGQSYWQITSINSIKNQLTLKNAKGRTLVWSPHNSGAREGFMEVYAPEERELMVGDKIRWRRNDPERHLINAQTATILGIEGKMALVQLANDKTLALDLTTPASQHFDYAYVSTIHLAQGDEAKNVLVLLESGYQKLHSWRSFYVILSRAASNLRIYTDDKKKLLKTILENVGDKTSSLEALGRLRRVFGQSNDTSTKKSASAQKAANTQTKSPSIPTWDAKTVSAALTNQAETVALQLLGEPKQRTPYSLAFGSKKGSLHVTIHGEKQGQWFDFQTGKGGHILQLIQETHQCTFKEALEIGARLTHLVPGATPLFSPATVHRIEKVKTQLSDYQQRRRLLAQQYFGKAQPVANTLGERYLQQHRHIPGLYPDDAIRFHPRLYTEGKYYPAVLFAARNAQGDIHAIQAVFLNPKTGEKVSTQELKVAKRTYGPLQGTAVTLQKGTQAGVELYAEGPETALSVARAYPQFTVKTTLGISHLKNMEWPKTTQTVVLCADNDGPAAITGETIKSVQEALQKLGKTVHVVMPAYGYKDFNDIIQKEGTEGIRKTMQLETRLQEGPSVKTPTPIPTLPAFEGKSAGPKLPSPDVTLSSRSATTLTRTTETRPHLPELER